MCLGDHGCDMLLLWPAAELFPAVTLTLSVEDFVSQGRRNPRSCGAATAGLIVAS